MSERTVNTTTWGGDRLTVVVYNDGDVSFTRERHEDAAFIVAGDTLRAALRELGVIDAPAAPEFAVGDTVRIGEHATWENGNYIVSRFWGRVGTVTEEQDDEGDYRVAVGGDRTYVAARHLTKVEPEPEPLAPWERELLATPAFAVGDTVRIGPNPETGTGGFVRTADFANKVGKIVEERGEAGYCVELPDGDQNTIGPAHLTKVDTPATSQSFAVGDTVRISEHAKRFDGADVRPAYRGAVGEIAETVDGDGECRVRMPNGVLTFVMATGLTKVNIPAATVDAECSAAILVDLRERVERLETRLSGVCEQYRLWDGS